MYKVDAQRKEREADEEGTESERERGRGRQRVGVKEGVERVQNVFAGLKRRVHCDRQSKAVHFVDS